MVKSKRRKLILGLFVGALLLPPAFLLACNYVVLNQSEKHIFRNLSLVPHHRVAIVLGTAPRIQGQSNIYFRGRIEAAANLYKSGKVDRILVSGDNGSLSYDEPTAMMKSLVALGVRQQHITKDCAGFRTLDTMIRAKKVFSLDDATIVTDDFHMSRSLFYAQRVGIRADGYPARDLKGQFTHAVRFREALARMRAVLDVDVLGTKPRYLGKAEVIP